MAWQHGLATYLSAYCWTAIATEIFAQSLIGVACALPSPPHPLPLDKRNKENNIIIIMKIEFKGRRSTNCFSLSSY